MDARSGELLEELPTGSRNLHGADLHRDGRRLAFGDSDGTLACLDLETGAELWRAGTPHLGAVNGVRFTPGGRHLFSVGRDRTVYYWNADTGRRAGPGRQLESVVQGVATSPDGRTVAAVHGCGAAAWDRVDGAPRWHLGELSNHGGLGEWALGFSHGGRRLWVGVDSPPYLRAFDLGGEGRFGPEVLALDTGGWVRALGFSPDGSQVAVLTRETLRALGAGDGEVHWSVELRASGLRHRNHLLDVLGFSPDAQRLWTLSEDGRVGCWSAGDGSVLNPGPVHERGVTGLRLSRSGRRLLVTTTVATAHLWEVPTGRYLWRFAPEPEPESRFASFEMRDLAGGRVGFDRVAKSGGVQGSFEVDLESEELPQPIPTPALRRRGISTDGSLEARVEVGRIGVYRQGEADPWRVLEGHPGPTHAEPVFFPDDRVLVCPGAGSWIRFWSLVTGALLLEHRVPVAEGSERCGHAMTLSGLGTHLALCAGDGAAWVLEVWRAAPGQGREELRVLRSRRLSIPQGAANQLALSADGRRLAVGTWWEREVWVHAVDDLLEPVAADPLP